MNLKKLSYREYILAFILIIFFIVSMSVVALSNKTDSIEVRVDSLEKDVNNIYE